MKFEGRTPRESETEPIFISMKVEFVDLVFTHRCRRQDGETHPSIDVFSLTNETGGERVEHQ